VTDDHFSAATRSQVGQQASEMMRNGESSLDETDAETRVFRGSADDFAELQRVEMGDEGLEPPTSTL